MRHIQSVHEGVKNICSQCGHQATQQSNLARHLRTILLVGGRTALHSLYDAQGGPPCA